MTTEKMTVHKALCELKTLDARITKAIQGSVYVFANKQEVAGSSPVVSTTNLKGEGFV